MEIANMMTLSTGHVTERTAKLIHREANSSESTWFPPVFKKGEYGYFIYVDEEYLTPNEDGEVEMLYPDIPEDLHACLSLAWEKGCRWLCLDRDCVEIGELPTYDWTEKTTALEWYEEVM